MLPEKLKSEISTSLKLSLNTQKLKDEMKIVPFIKQNSVKISDYKELEFIELLISGSEFTVNEKYILVVQNNKIFVYKNAKNISLHKIIERNYLLFHFKSLSKEIRKFFLKILLNILEVFRFEAYLEAIMFYLKFDEIFCVKEIEDGVEIEYIDGTKKFFDQNLNEKFILSPCANLSKNTEKIKIFFEKNEMKILRVDSKYVDKRVIGKIKDYCAVDNRIFILQKERILIVKFNL